MSNKTRVKQLFLNSLWAIEPHWLETAKAVLFLGEKYQIPEREIESEQALLFAEGEKPKNTHYTIVKDRTAIIDIYGAIIPRADWLSEWSGGVSCELLSKDIKHAVNSADIENILLSIHSPGGEITGIQEIAEQVFEARKTKRITAYASGMACSAAYWIGSAAGDFVVNPTSILGSIGVMAVYLDDSKHLEMNGFKEIEFISSQSPHKNAKPTSKQGKKRIQARVDSLAQVFVETVARNRDESVEKVLEGFGQGDVFIGQDAVDAGLADRIGLFSDSLKLLNDEVEPGASSLALNANGTIQDSFKLRSNSLPQKSMTIFSKQGEIPKGENMATEEKTVSKAEFEKLQEKFDKSEEKNETLEQSNQDLQSEALEKEMAEVAEKFQGETEPTTEFLVSLVNTFGKDSSEYEFFVKNQTALSAQITEGLLFEDTGDDNADTDSDPLAELNKKAEEIAKAKNIPVSEAFLEAAEANSELYEEYNAERQSGGNN